MASYSASVPGVVKIGEVHKKTHKFEDPVALAKEGGMAKINAIKVFYNEKHVLGLTIYYKLADGGYLKAAHNPQKDKKSIQKRTLEIGPDDYLIEISGHRTDKAITRLSFLTYRGKEGTYGSDAGSPFIYKFDGYTFGPFCGGFKDYLRHLEIPVYPVPEQFLKELRPVQVNIIIKNNVVEDLHKSEPIAQQQQLPQVGFNQAPVQGFQGMYIKPVDNFGQVFVPQVVGGSNNNFQPFYQPVNNQQQYSYPEPGVNSNEQPKTFSSKYPSFK